MNIKQKIGVLVAVAIALFGGSYTATQLAGVEIGNEYIATTTPQVSDLRVLCVGPGSLSNVDVLTLGTGYLALLDATTSNINFRANEFGRPTATTSIILTWLPNGVGTSTHITDVKFVNGLMVHYSSGVPTSTIAYRCQS